MDEVLPLVREAIPEVTVTVVGRNPSDKLRQLAEQAGVRVTGTVPDVRPFVQRASVYIVPLRIGGGTRLKIYEALAMGKAVVSTTIGAEGLPLEEGVHILRSDEAADFARKVVALLEDPVRREALGDAGRALMEERFSWARVAEEFETHCREAVS
jgi:glycosyltransferase involved in cell wall biosynthesis